MESLFVLLRMSHLLCKVKTIGINLIQLVHMLYFNVCRWNPYKRPAKNLSCHIGVLAKAQYDISKFYHVRQNIV